jgi:HEAT repeat protein
MDDLIKALAGGDESERLYAVQDMTRLPDASEVAKQLLDRLPKEPSQVVRNAIVFALKKIDCSDVHEHLFQMFFSHDAFLRNEAVAVFGQGGDNALAFLASSLDHPDREVRKLIMDALFLIGTKDAVLAIRAGLHDPSANVKITAVEYLGRLQDAESTEEMLECFKNDSEPMLRTSILDALTNIGKEETAGNVLSVLAPDGDIRKVDPVYIPQVIELISRTGDMEAIKIMFEAVNIFSEYGEEIVRAAGAAEKRLSGTLAEEGITAQVIAIASDKEARIETRYAAVELLIGHECNALQTDILYDLGVRLLEEKDMIYPAVKLLVLCSSDLSATLIKKLMTETEDEELRLFCEELTSGNE